MKTEFRRLSTMKKKPAGDESAFDVHQTDPARLKREVKKDLGTVAPVQVDTRRLNK